MSGDTSLLKDVLGISATYKAEKDGCKKCPLRKANARVLGDIVPGSSIVFVGEAPGEEEVKEGKPFVGRSGNLLRKTLANLGVEKYSIVNTVECRPTDEAGKNRAPTPQEIRLCALSLPDKINGYNTVVLLGAVALNAVLPDAKISDMAGSGFILNGKRYLVAYHPAYILRNQDDVSVFDKWMSGLDKLNKWQRGEFGVPYTLVDDANVDEALKTLSASTRLFLDTETTSLEKFNCRTLCIGIGDDKNIFVFKGTPVIIGKLKEFFKKSFEVITHNILFDVGVLYGNGIILDGCTLKDTMFEAYLLNEDHHRAVYKMKYLAKELLDYSYDGLVIECFKEKLEDVYNYNAEDIFVLRSLFNYYQSHTTDKMKALEKDAVSGATFVVNEIEYYGFKIDKEQIEKTRDAVDGKIVTLEGMLKDVIGGEVNLKSGPQIEKFLASKGLTNCKKTATGRMCLDEEAIFTVLNDKGDLDPDVKFVLEGLIKYRGLFRLKNTVLEGIMSRMSADGRIRSNYSFVNSVTGRLSSSNPNLQNIDRETLVRNLFIAEEGYKLLEVDLSQIELRVAASVAHEEEMIDAFNKGKDLHTVTASALSGVSEDKVTPEQRQAAKAVNFGFLYGAGSENFRKLAKQEYDVEMDSKEAAYFRRKFFDTYPALPRWHKDCAEILKTGSGVESPLGRMRRLTVDANTTLEEASHYTRQTINAPIQGTAADICFMLMGDFFTKRNQKWVIKDVHFVSTVYDSFGAEIKEALVEEVCSLISECLWDVKKRLPWFTVPLGAEIKVGNSWGSMLKVKKLETLKD